MILSNTEIVGGLERGDFAIGPLAGEDPTCKPFNTSAVDLRLADEILALEPDAPSPIDLSRHNVAEMWSHHAKHFSITEDRPFQLKSGQLILAKTIEKVDFPIREGRPVYSARVEGRSSLARCGILVHFTAPTIHAGFSGTITLEITNMSPIHYLLHPGIFICQLIIEEVKGTPVVTDSQFRGQTRAAGRH